MRFAVPSILLFLALSTAAPAFAAGGIAGKVVDEAGQPVSIGRVRICQETWLARLDLGDGGREVDIGVDGTWKAADLAPGAYTFMFMKLPDFAIHYEHGVAVEEGKQTALNVTLLKGGTISGCCKTGDRTVGRVVVAVFRNGWVCGLSEPSDAKGAYTTGPVEPGTYTLVAEAPETARLARGVIGAVSVEAGKTLAGRNFELAKHSDAPSLRVIARTFDGDVADKLRCALLSPDGNALYRPAAGLPRSSARTGRTLSDALAVFTGIPAGDGYQVMVLESTLGTGSTKAAVRSKQSFATVLMGEGPLGRIAGTASAGGQPLPGAVVIVNDDSIAGRANDADFQTEAGADGAWSIELPPGRYAVQVVDPSRKHATEITAGVIVRPGQAATVDAALSPGGSVSGVCLRGGKPAVGVGVFAIRDGLQWGWAGSGADGAYVIEHVKPGPYYLYLMYKPEREGRPAVARPAPELIVVAGQELKVGTFDLKLTGLAELRATARAGGAPVQDLNLVLRDEASGFCLPPFPRHNPEAKDPHWPFCAWRGVPPGSYTLHVLNPGYEPADRPVRLAPGENDVELELEKSAPRQ